MQFKILDEMMRVYETTHDYSVLPGIYIIARLDGRNFTRLTKEKQSITANRNRIKHDLELPMNEEYSKFIFRIMENYL